MFYLIHEDKLDLNIIAIQLFRDVILFNKLGNIHAMRFNKDVMDFWCTFGLLFQPKGLRFMGGYKCIGTLDANKDRTNLTPDIARFNFIVPVTKELRKHKDAAGIDVQTCHHPA